jgi:hypothetical protein
VPPVAAAAAAGVPPGPVDVLLGWTLDTPAWLDAFEGGTVRTILGGYALTRDIVAGRVRYVPVRLSALPKMLAGPWRPDVLVVSAVRRGGRFGFRSGPGWAAIAARWAEAVVVEVADGADHGGPDVPGHVAAVLPGGELVPAAVVPESGPVEAAIAEHVARLIPEGATVEYGAGALPDAVVRAIDRPVAIHTGLATDAVAALAERGRLLRPAVAAYLWGGPLLQELAADAASGSSGRTRPTIPVRSRRSPGSSP